MLGRVVKKTRHPLIIIEKPSGLSLCFTHVPQPSFSHCRRELPTGCSSQVWMVGALADIGTQTNYSTVREARWKS
jgi:hypothetical protein